MTRASPSSKICSFVKVKKKLSMRKETEATGKGRAGWKGKRRHAKRKPNIKRIIVLVILIKIKLLSSLLCTNLLLHTGTRHSGSTNVQPVQ